MNKLLRIIEFLNELKTGRPAHAKNEPTNSFRFGYQSTVDDLGITETYFLPFTKVEIFTPNTFPQ